jgi:hypothetical protein
MNETELIRAQLALEREHLNAVARTCAQSLAGATAAAGSPGPALQPFHQDATAYLALVLGWYDERDRRLEALAASLGGADPRCTTVREILARAGTSGEAQAKLAAARADSGAWQALAAFLGGPWSTRRDALERLLANDSRPGDWRLIGGIDADGMLAERGRFARLAALMPPGASTDQLQPSA